jgi:hypothetical protein
MFNDPGVYNAMQEFEQNILMVLSLTSVPSTIIFLLEHLCGFRIR